MKSYCEMLDEARAKRMYSNAVEEHLKDIASLLAALCDEINGLNESVNRLGSGVDWLEVLARSQ